MNTRHKIATLAMILAVVLLHPFSGSVLAQPDALDRARALNKEVLQHLEQGRYREAIPLAREALAIREKALGPDHPLTAVSLNNLAELFRSMGDYAQAESLYQRALAIQEKASGPDHPGTAIPLNNLALLYKSMGKYAQAEPLYRRGLAINEKALGPDHPDVATDLNNLAELLRVMGDYAQAEPLYRRALAIDEKALGPDHPDLTTDLNNLALLYHAKGDYAQAEPLLQRALAIREKTLGPDHPRTAICLNNLAMLYKAMGDYAQAQPLYRRALGIDEKALGPHHPDVAVDLNNLAALHRALGEYDQAEPLYKRALAIDEKSLGPDHPDVATDINNLALLYRSVGDLARAEPLLVRALAIREKALGPDHADTASGLNNLASLYVAKGRPDQAEPLYRRALAIDEKALGSLHPGVAADLNNLALLHESRGDYDKARPLLERAISIKQKAVGPDHPDTAASLSNLAGVYASMGDYTRAEPLYRTALAISEKALGPEHPAVGLRLAHLAWLMAAKGDYASAHDLFMRSHKISAKLIDQVMGFTSEDQKMKFLATLSGGLESSISLVARYRASDRQAVVDVLNVWLGRKGVILEAQRRYQEALVYSDDPEAVRVLSELAGVRSRLSRMAFDGPGPEGPEAYRSRIARLEALEKELDAKLSRLSQAFAREKNAKHADTRKVAQALPKGSVLLDFARIHPFQFQATGQEPQWGPAHYYAFVLHAGLGDQARLVDLGGSEPMDLAVAELKAGMAETKDIQGAKAKAAGEKLYQMVFAPLEKELGEAREVFLSPDGTLNLVPFEVLRKPDGKFLIEEYSFNYLASGRDLAGFGQVRGKTGPPLLMGDPDFGLDGEAKEKITRELGLAPAGDVRTAGLTPDLRGLRFTPLPGTGEEVKTIQAILGPDAVMYTGKQALEEVLAARKEAPRILHLATHGFFLTDQQVLALTNRRTLQFEEASPPAMPRMENPLIRSGLALAGVNRSLESGSATGGDGLFTAEEVLGLRLHGADLVVLSACNTGTGEVKAGEGVYGLRRAFVQSGTKGLVMSLWPVPDRETKELMVQFYKNIDSGTMNRREALRQAALTEMKTVQARYGTTHPLFWGAFVYLGDPGMVE